MTRNQIVIQQTPITVSSVDTAREVYDFQVEGNENFFVFGTEDAPAPALLVHNCMLVPLESPPPSTTWIIGSMDPAKFEADQDGRSFINRCTQYILKAPADESLHLQARRIMKGEGIKYITKAQRELLVGACGREMRTLANLIQFAQAHYEGLADKPETLSDEDMGEVLTSNESEDGKTAVRFLTCIYAGKFTAAQREILAVGDGYGIISTLLNLNWFLLNDAILKGQRHPAIWGNAAAYALRAQVKEVSEGQNISGTALIERMGLVQAGLTTLKAQAQTFAVKEVMALSRFAYSTIRALKAGG